MKKSVNGGVAGKSGGARSKRPAALEFKPDLDEAARRWEAFYAGEMIDRPVVCVTAPKDGYRILPRSNYRERVQGDMDAVIARVLHNAAGTFYGGEAVPSFGLSFGPDEIACFCGAELKWSNDSGDTNWSEPFVDDWASSLPLRLKPDAPLWLRMLEFYRRAAERVAGKMLICPPDLHTNMDLLMAIRGSERLCMDLLDQPEMIDRAMSDARAVFPEVWSRVAEAGRMDERGYCHTIYSMEGASFLQCDFSCMMSPEMFNRWVLPALEEEASIVRHAVYHWDGPGALVHADALIASKGLHTLSYVPGAGRGGHLDHADLLRRVQDGGKSVQVWGSVEEVKQLHKMLRPEKSLYCPSVKTRAEAEDLLEWFVQNT